MAEVRPIRQGDVWIIPLTEAEERAYNRYRGYFSAVRRKKGEGLILAAGEATGHHHRIRDPHARMRRRNTRSFSGDPLAPVETVLRSPKGGTTVTHEEHAALDIPEGLYKVVIAREYSPSSAPVRVRD